MTALDTPEDAATFAVRLGYVRTAAAEVQLRADLVAEYGCTPERAANAVDAAVAARYAEQARSRLRRPLRLRSRPRGG